MFSHSLLTAFTLRGNFEKFHKKLWPKIRDGERLKIKDLEISKKRIRKLVKKYLAVPES